MSAGDELGKSLRPIAPANTRSPDSRRASVDRHTLPGVWPGVWMTWISNPANVSTSPSTTVRTSFTGTGGVWSPAPQPCGSVSAATSASWM